MEERAKAFATHHHSAIGQKRKYTHDPYIVHPAAVVEIVRSVPHTPEMIAAAWLHDIVEDTPVTLTEINNEFGPEVGELVEMLTDVSELTDGNRATRKAIDRMHTAQASPQAQTIKLADLIDNSDSILAHDPQFARVYIEEKRLLLDVLAKGDPDLWAMANAIVQANLTKQHSVTGTELG